jgi:hypothetical protein
MPSSFYDQVVRKTLDPGYRFVAQQLDGWGSLCTPVGGPLTQAEVAAFANGLKSLEHGPGAGLARDRDRRPHRELLSRDRFPC